MTGNTDNNDMTLEPLPFDSVLSRKIMSALSKRPEGRPDSCQSVLDAAPSTANKGGTDEKATANAAKSSADRQSTWRKLFRKPFLWRVAFLLGLLVIALLEPGSATRQLICTLFDEVGYTAEPMTMGGCGPKVGDTKSIVLPGGAMMEMVWCPPGSFVMGSPLTEEDRNTDETQHRVTLTKGFWMGKYEVTQRQWESVIGENPSKFKGADRPVENVSWDDCQTFVRKINATGIVKVALPTEAQWKYACRAGTITPFSFGSSLNGDKANCDGNLPYGITDKGRYRKETALVGSYVPNAWGLYDVHGNVFEWCADWYGSSNEDLIDPTGPSSGVKRVIRGGGWFGHVKCCRAAFRGSPNPTWRHETVGLRLVCSTGDFE